MMKNIDDIFLLQRIKEDDEAAFKYLFDTYFTAVYRLSFFYIKKEGRKQGKVSKREMDYKLLLDTAVFAGDILMQNGEEIALDVFTALWEKRKTIEIKLSIKAYLLTSARNRTLNYLRDHEQELYTENISLFESAIEEYPLEMKELEQLINEAIYALPDKCREVFLKSRMENRSNKEIATDMNITVKTVEAQITKALKHIKTHLGKGYHYLF